MKHKLKKIKKCPTQGKRQKHRRTKFISLCPTKRGRELCSYVLMSKKEEPSMEIRSFFQKVSHARNKTEAHKNRIYVLMTISDPRSSKKWSFCLNKCGADPRSPIPDPRKNGIGAIFLGAKMLKMRKKLKKTIIFCQ